MVSNKFKNLNWLELKNIDISYGSKLIVKNLNLNLALGENTVLIGANGSGKSTILKTISRLKYPLFKRNSYIKLFNSSKGNVWELRSKIGFVVTEIDSRIKRNMLVRDVILSGYQGTFGLINENLITDSQINGLDYIIDKLNLKNINQYYSKLSDGQKRRVLIARSLVKRPKVLILDEPTNMLDIKSNYELLEVLSTLTKEGVTLLYVTNNIENIIKETSRVIFLKHGNILVDGSPSKVLNSTNISNLYDYNLEIKNIEGHWRTIPK